MRLQKKNLYKRVDILLELFVHSENIPLGFAHICMEVTDLESIAAICEQSRYSVIRIKRINKHNILFFKDRAGNIFELKEGRL